MFSMNFVAFICKQFFYDLRFITITMSLTVKMKEITRLYHLLKKKHRNNIKNFDEMTKTDWKH